MKQLPLTPGSAGAGATTRQVFTISGGAMELAVAQPTIQNVALLHRMALVQRRKLHEEVQVRQEALGITMGGAGVGSAGGGGSDGPGPNLGMTTPKHALGLACGGEEDEEEADEAPSPFATVARQPTIPAPTTAAAAAAAASKRPPAVQKKLSWGPDVLEGALAEQQQGSGALVLGGRGSADEGEEDDWAGFLDAPKQQSQQASLPMAPAETMASARAPSPVGTSTSSTGSNKPPKPARPTGLSFHPLPTTIVTAPAPAPAPAPEFDEDGWPVFPAQRAPQPALQRLGLEQQLFSGSAKAGAAAADGSLSPLDGLLTPKDDAGAGGVTPPPSQRASVGGRRKHLSLELKSDDLQRAMRNQQMSAQEVAAKLGAVVEGGESGEAGGLGLGMGEGLPGAAEEDGLAPAIPISPGGGRGGAGGAPADRWSIRSGRIDVDGLFKISSKVGLCALDDRHDASDRASSMIVPALVLTSPKHQPTTTPTGHRVRQRGAAPLGAAGEPQREQLHRADGAGAGQRRRGLQGPAHPQHEGAWAESGRAPCPPGNPSILTQTLALLTQTNHDRWWP